MVSGVQPGARPTLLVVDDEPLIASYVASIAELEGWAVEMAVTTAEFDSRIQASEPDTLVMDLAMPGRDGVELLRFLSSKGYRGNLIIVSACDESVLETSASLGRNYGLAVSGYLQKPIAAEALAALLRQIVAMIPVSALDGSH